MVRSQLSPGLLLGDTWVGGDKRQGPNTPFPCIDQHPTAEGPQSLSALFLCFKSSLSPVFLGCYPGACSTQRSQRRLLNHS